MEVFVGILVLAMMIVLYYMGISFFGAIEHISSQNKKYMGKKPPALVENSNIIIQIKHRNPVAIIVLSIITLGIYAIYWTVKTKEEMNSLGASIPTAWLIIVPLANIYFAYRYMEGFSVYVKKDNHPILWFFFHLIIAPIAMIFIQIELNKYAGGQQNGGNV